MINNCSILSGLRAIKGSVVMNMACLLTLIFSVRPNPNDPGHIFVYSLLVFTHACTVTVQVASAFVTSPKMVTLVSIDIVVTILKIFTFLQCCGYSLINMGYVTSHAKEHLFTIWMSIEAMIFVAVILSNMCFMLVRCVFKDLINLDNRLMRFKPESDFLLVKQQTIQIYCIPVLPVFVMGTQALVVPNKAMRDDPGYSTVIVGFAFSLIQFIICNLVFVINS